MTPEEITEKKKRFGRLVQLTICAGDLWAISQALKYFVDNRPAPGSASEHSWNKLAALAIAFEETGKNVIDGKADSASVTVSSSPVMVKGEITDFVNVTDQDSIQSRAM